MKNYIIVILDKMNGLTNEIKAAKEYLDCGQNKKMYKSGLVVNPAFC